MYWEAKLIVTFADQLWFRFLLGWLMPPMISLLKITQGEAIRKYYHDNHVIQDVLLPLHKVGDALEFIHREMEVYPVWLCPFKLPVVVTTTTKKKTMVHPEPGFEEEPHQMFTDVGAYYAPRPCTGWSSGRSATTGTRRSTRCRS
jgi:Delta24-sterol reductase